MDDQLMEQVDSEISAAPADNQGEMSMITQKSSRGYVPWNDEMDKVLLDTFVEYFNKGDRCQNGWKPHVYTAAVKNVREKCNVNITKSNIDSRSKTFDKHYHVISGLLSTSGFGWDWEKNKLKVDSDSVWDDYVERNKDAKGYRHKIVKFWDLLSVVYNKDQANGEAARTAAESSKEMAREIGTSKDPAGSTSTTTSSLKRQRSDDSFNSLWSEKLDMLTAILKDDAPKLPSSVEVLAALQEIEGLDEDTELELYDILTENARKFESMMALPVERRKRWLMKQLRK
ncbi:hypothetical protein EJB05_52080, partial [Eragrostis curvula]